MQLLRVRVNRARAGVSATKPVARGWYGPRLHGQGKSTVPPLNRVPLTGSHDRGATLLPLRAANPPMPRGAWKAQNNVILRRVRKRRNSETRETIMDLIRVVLESRSAESGPGVLRRGALEAEGR